MKPISQLRFNSLAGYSRLPIMPLIISELGWFEEADEKVLGLVALDLTDGDYACYVLGRDAKGRFRAIWVGCSIPTVEEAYAELEAKLQEHAQMPPSAFYQGDEIGKLLDILQPVVALEKQHSHFRQLISKRGWSPARGLLAEMAHYFDDVDRKFAKRFQTTEFDARLWELYLFALFTELGYAVIRKHTAPDFHLTGLGDEFFMEAMTVNLSGTAPTFDDSPTQEYFEHYVPIRFRDALFKKLEHKHQGKRYWELPHVVGHPFVLAVQDFHAPKFTSMFWSSSALVEYLYGIRQVERRAADGSVEIVSERVDSYKWENRVITAGFFSQPDTENISAVLANPEGTLSKFNRMGFLAGFGDRDIRMFRSGRCYQDSLTEGQFFAEIHSPDYSETWCDGLSVYHNPNAKHPLSPDAIPGAAHHTSRKDRIFSQLPKFHTVGSLTSIFPASKVEKT